MKTHRRKVIPISDGQRRKATNKNECVCNHGWICEEHPDKPFEHDPDCPGPGIQCRNPNCDWDPDAIFAIIHCSNN